MSQTPDPSSDSDMFMFPWGCEMPSRWQGHPPILPKTTLGSIQPHQPPTIPLHFLPSFPSTFALPPLLFPHRPQYPSAHPTFQVQPQPPAANWLSGIEASAAVTENEPELGTDTGESSVAATLHIYLVSYLYSYTIPDLSKDESLYQTVCQCHCVLCHLFKGGM